MGDYVAGPLPTTETTRWRIRAPARRCTVAEPGQALDPAQPEVGARRRGAAALVETHDVVLDGFRPGVLDRLGVGYERLHETTRDRLLRHHGLRAGRPNTQRSGHDMNYLGLIGMLGLSGPAGPPVQSAGQIADLGGGGLMAAFGVMAALHERSRSGEGQS